MAIVSSQGFAHVRLTVTDIARSKAFYDSVFGWPIAADQSERVDEPGVREDPDQVYGGTIYQSPSGALLGLRPVAVTGDTFEAGRTGLDHVSFVVASRADLDSAHEALHQLGAPHGEVKELAGFGLAILSFSDPDGIQLELTAEL